jgi:hypothetical protein
MQPKISMTTSLKDTDLYWYLFILHMITKKYDQVCKNITL